MFYFVDAAVVRNPEISEGFRYCFFWRNGGEADFVTGETEKSLSIGKSGGFIMEKTPTTEGDLYRYFIGPFVPKDIGLGEHAVLFYDWERAVNVAALWINNFYYMTDPKPDKPDRKAWAKWANSMISKPR